MVIEGNADSKLSVKKMQCEESVRTIDCLRGRLVAERTASRNAKEEADKLENKLVELESLLKEEAKSRNKAEKKLNYLIKKLKSMNISYVSDVSEHSGLVDGSDISSVSSIASSIMKSPEEKTINPLLEITTTEGSSISELEITTTEGSSISKLEASLPERKDEESESGSNEFQEKNTSSDEEKPKAKELRGESSNEEGYDQDDETQVDNSMALVLVETPERKEQKIDPEVLDATVKEVLDALKHAKEQLQSSIERKRSINMIRVG